MKKLVAALAALAVLSTSSVALAGVVMVQQEEVIGAGQNRKIERTIMIEGNKEKMLTSGHQVITDLDKGVMYIIYPQRKVYMQMPFPPRGAAAHMMHKPAFRGASFKKTGKTRTIAGHPCDEYTSSGKFDMGQYTVRECISTKAPGAADFIAFEKHMKAALKGSAYDTSEGRNMPTGVPLAQDATTRITKFNFPNLSPKEAAKLKKEMQGHPPIVSKIEVTKISEEKLPASTFEVPAGFKEERFPTMSHGAMGGHGSGVKK